MNKTAFDTAFAALTGHAPFPWQWRLYDEWFSKGKFPPSCNLPTGLGKTSVVAVWLWALAANPQQVPRRLVYVVNRRTVVDQTTTEAEKYRQLLVHGRQPLLPCLIDLAATLRGMTADPDGPPLAISTLRGQFADNREWSADPSRPAIIVGTVDMIGSRLLFSGYGCGFKTRPLHAGFLGQDALLVHDEAHLEPAFQKLLIAIEEEQRRERREAQPWASLRVMELSATSRGGGDVFELSDQDRAEAEVQKRIGAKKAVHLHENKDEKKLADEIAELALKHKSTGRAVLVFVRKVDDVEKVVARLRKEKMPVQQLTGTIRGWERERLVGDPIFRRFLPRAGRDNKTVYLVCTSAGEVGVNISADDLVCDLSTFESMAQRFGRVNRFGERDDTRVDVVHPKAFDETDPVDSRRERMLALLRGLNGDGSPASLGRLDPDARLAAFSPTPTILPTSDVLFDAWALTTVRERLPGRPRVEPYLHGVAEWQPPETHVGWREEVWEVRGGMLSEHPPKDLLEDYPLKPHELLRDSTSRVFDRLKKLKAPADTPVWLVADDDSVRVRTLGEVIEAGKDELDRQTLLLPPRAGGLDAAGMLTSDSATPAEDVADRLTNEQGLQRRVRVRDEDDAPLGMRLVRRIDFQPPEDDEDAEGRSWFWFESPNGGDGEGSRANQKPVLWDVHTCDVVENTTAIIANLHLSEEMKAAFEVAAWLHDLGKKRRVFQHVLGNRVPGRWLAKSGKKGGRVEEKYRHEFGSLLDLEGDDRFKALGDDMKELVRHVIATHHGRGRPHFPADEAFDPEPPKGPDASAVAAEVPQRFARLQRRYGRWGLAYLESLLRAADYAASARPRSFVEDAQ